jgi:hypothetical protein
MITYNTGSFGQIYCLNGDLKIKNKDDSAKLYAVISMWSCFYVPVFWRETRVFEIKISLRSPSLPLTKLSYTVQVPNSLCAEINQPGLPMLHTGNGGLRLGSRLTCTLGFLFVQKA